MSKIEEQYEDAAIYAQRYDVFEPPEFLKWADIDPDEWHAWQLHDVFDTLSTLAANGKEATAQEVGATMLTHVFLAFRMGYLRGKGLI